MEQLKRKVYKMDKELKFEDKMNRLKTIVSELEKEDIELDKTISLYEEGLNLSKELKEELNKFENTINELNGENNG